MILTLITEESDVNIYNYLEAYNDPDWTSFVTSSRVRRALHVGDVEFGDKGAGNALDLDEMVSVAPWVEELLENYPVLLYTGQVDIICGYPMALDYINALNFTGMDEYLRNDRKVWYIDSGREVAGYYRLGGNLTELLVRNSGHMVPRDQPAAGYDMLYRFTRNISFGDEL